MRCQGKPLFELGLPKRPVPTGAPVLLNKGIFTGKEYREIDRANASTQPDGSKD
jgi:hypothetical protein